MNSAARIDFAMVSSVSAEFPKGSWKEMKGSSLHAPTPRDSRARAWGPLGPLRNIGGNYAFLFPAADFQEDQVIALDGPGGRKIPFIFSSSTQPTVDGLLVAYVGKAANLHQRFRWHFGLAKKNTGAQVQYGLVKAGACADRGLAVDRMLRHCVIVYRELSGDENAANRDLLELSLCARFAPPFNIKSER